jgi:hypothetical protein
MSLVPGKRAIRGRHLVRKSSTDEMRWANVNLWSAKNSIRRFSAQCNIVIRCYTVFLRPEEIFGRHKLASFCQVARVANCGADSLWPGRSSF